MLTPVFHNPNLAPMELTILNAAINLAIRTSADRISMTQIQKVAGVSKATLYQYFAGKLDIWAAILLEEDIERARDAGPLVRNGDADAWESYFYRLTLHPAKLVVLQKMEQALRQEDPDLPRYKDWLRQRRSYLSLMVQAAQQHGVDEMEARQRVAMVWTTLEGWLRLYNEPDFREFCAGRQIFAQTLAKQFSQWVMDA
ncbi:TetR/AcrR family transcriptional regulator [Salinispirillum sp. LH 10-3-1]|uniref:TetR/AcrR family transcriptional regulator n=1 Tax=Salinispirillum sp. LH 10-3-1 TaxID=2952525 RepID=A0AB38YBB2_9GAMM